MKKYYVKIISPNFDLKYGLSKKEIEERFKKLIKYSDPDKTKKHYLFGQKVYLVVIVLMKYLIFKELILKNFSKNHTIIFGVNNIKEKFTSIFIIV